MVIPPKQRIMSFVKLTGTNTRLCLRPKRSFYLPHIAKAFMFLGIFLNSAAKYGLNFPTSLLVAF